MMVGLLVLAVYAFGAVPKNSCRPMPACST